MESFLRMTRFSTPRRVASPKASIAFPLRVPGPQIVLVSVVVVLDLDEVARDSNDSALERREGYILRWEDRLNYVGARWSPGPP